MIFCAHSDDEAVGMGGTIIKYTQEGKKIIKVIFSYGEGSHPHLKERVIINTRVGETEKISKEFGIDKTIFLGIPDMKIKDQINDPKFIQKISSLIKKYKPSKIFIPSELDPHPDHSAVHKGVIAALKKSKTKEEVLIFEVWNLIEENLPRYYIDISDYFKGKIKMMKCFKSQKHFIYPLLIPMIIRAKKYGLANNCKYAERFYRLK